MFGNKKIRLFALPNEITFFNTEREAQIIVQTFFFFIKNRYPPPLYN